MSSSAGSRSVGGSDYDALGVSEHPRVNLGELEARLEVIRPDELQVRGKEEGGGGD